MNNQKLLVVAITVFIAISTGVVAKEEKQELIREGGDWPTDPQALKFLEREIEIGNVGPLLQVFIPMMPRYLVTYMNSQTRDKIRSATVVSVTNQSQATCRVAVSYFRGFTSNAAPACSTSFSISPDFTVDFCSRNLPMPITTCNSICSPGLDFHEGRSIVSSTCKEIGVSSRVYYTLGDDDGEISAITDSKIVRVDEGNKGD